MHRYARDTEGDDEGGHSERGAQGRDDERGRPDRGEARGATGGRREPGDERRQYPPPAYRAGPGDNRWSESPRDRERFEHSYGRGGGQRDDVNAGGPRRDEDWRDTRGTWSDQGGRWRPGASTAGSRPMPSGPYGQYGQYDETEYGMYGPHDDGGAPPSGYGTVGYGDPRRRDRDAYGGGRGQGGSERADDRWNRQGYGQSSWQGEMERGRDDAHPMDDPDYRQWREEQIRKLDEDYRRYRQERYRKFADEFGLWRKNLETSTGAAGETGPASSASQTPTGSSSTRDASGDAAGAERDSPGAGTTRR